MPDRILKSQTTFRATTVVDTKRMIKPLPISNPGHIIHAHERFLINHISSSIKHNTLVYHVNTQQQRPPWSSTETICCPQSPHKPLSSLRSKLASFLQHVQLWQESEHNYNIVHRRKRALLRLAQGASVQSFVKAHGSRSDCAYRTCADMIKVFNEALEDAKAAKAIEDAELREEEAY